MNLIAMTPHPELTSTTYCLADAGSEYLVYQPKNESFDIALAEGAYEGQWFDTATGSTSATGTIKTEAGKLRFTPPFQDPAVLSLKRKK